MRRRDFITLLGGAAVAGAVGARAQQARMPVIGFLHTASAGSYVSQLKAFDRALKETGYVEGKNVAIEYRWAENDLDRLSALAGDLVRRKVSIIVAGGSPASALAAKSATTTIPIVFLNAADPVGIGLLQPAGRKRNRRYLAQCRTSGKAAGNPS
jgi:putative tryptophan/tyrosine transport system substrate-binding protein